MVRAVAMLALDALCIAISLVIVSLGGDVGFLGLAAGCFAAAHLAVSSRRYVMLRNERRAK